MSETTHREGTNLRRTPPGVGRPAMLGLAGAAMLATAPAVPQRDGDDADETRDCINLNDIDRTSVPDEDTVLFYMRGGDVYRNELQSRCPNLDFDERFMYRTTLNRLCSADVITVIDDIGFGFRPGASCGLGKFQRIGEEEAERLLEERRDRD